MTRDHPREYGENLVTDPPLRHHGIIPANTGRIDTASSLPLSGGDHPREYGENLGTMTAPGTPMGSSPRIRGEFPGYLEESNPLGIIPANTGRIS